jgi:hypothetical protein
MMILEKRTEKIDIDNRKNRKSVIFFFPSEQTFGLAYSPLNSDNLSFLSEFTLE